MLVQTVENGEKYFGVGDGKGLMDQDQGEDEPLPWLNCVSYRCILQHVVQYDLHVLERIKMR